MTSIGYGDISPQNANERLFGVITMITSSALFGVIIGNIGSLLEKYNMKAKARTDALINLNCYLKKYNLGSDIRNKSRRFIDYSFHDDKYDEPILLEILSNLSQPLQEEIILHTNGNIINYCKSFEIFSQTHINKLAKRLQVTIFSPLDEIISEGEQSTGMYFITTGTVEVYDSSTSCRIQLLTDKSYFGEIGLFTKQGCVSSVYALNFSETLFLNILEFEKFINLMPAIKETIDDIRKSCSEGDYSALNLHCYSCRQLGHIAKHCQAILNDDGIKEKWINRTKEAKKLNIYEYRKVQYKRKKNYARRYDYSAKNVIGKKRRVGEMFPKVDSVLKNIKRYFQNNIKGSDTGSVLHTEESIMNTSIIKILHPEWILSSSDEEINENQEINKIRY